MKKSKKNSHPNITCFGFGQLRYALAFFISCMSFIVMITNTHMAYAFNENYKLEEIDHIHICSTLANINNKSVSSFITKHLKVTPPKISNGPLNVKFEDKQKHVVLAFSLKEHRDEIISCLSKFPIYGPHWANKTKEASDQVGTRITHSELLRKYAGPSYKSRAQVEGEKALLISDIWLNEFKNPECAIADLFEHRALNIDLKDSC